MDPAPAAEVKIVPDAAALSRAGAEEFSRCASEAIAARDRFSVALSGGNTPRGVYASLAETAKDSLPWDKIYVFFGDERHVPPGDPQSNYRMANETLLGHVPIPEQNVFRVPAELDADSAAIKYERALRDFFGLAPQGWPRFDLILLGLGEDGHTASLFPDSPALKETSRLVVANWVEKLRSYRITVTYPLLNHAEEVVFLVAGGNKSQILPEILRTPGTEKFPSQAVRPLEGRLLWIVDQAAARLL